MKFKVGDYVMLSEKGKKFQKEHPLKNPIAYAETGIVVREKNKKKKIFIIEWKKAGDIRHHDYEIEKTPEESGYVQHEGGVKIEGNFVREEAEKSDSSPVTQEEKIKEVIDRLYNLNADISVYFIGMKKIPTQENMKEINEVLGEQIKKLKEVIL